MIQQMTGTTKQQDIVRGWHLIDVKDVMLGRIASEIATILMGKSKPYFVRNLDCGDHVVIINAKQVKTTGNKEQQKKYFRYSGYPGGLSVETLAELRVRKPEEILKHAVKGMLPQNKLRDRMLQRLHIFADETHEYQDKFKGQNVEVKS